MTMPNAAASGNGLRRNDSMGPAAPGCAEWSASVRFRAFLPHTLRDAGAVLRSPEQWRGTARTVSHL